MAIVLPGFAAIFTARLFFKFECRISSNLAQNQAKFNPRRCIIKNKFAKERAWRD
ncbi:hypothetical protein [uncultured Campylobacter sp.]|uniref:hypothetical protein n=1 Tax=uncultured Campylobacter sp. TaxID=218934 RepID=UPI002618945A|nr:hypothetical protein [uncultured Campylobacter sp.]